MFVEHAEPAVAVAEHDQILTQQPHFLRRAIRFRDFFAHAGGDPVAPHQSAHGGIAFDATQNFVFLAGEHGVLSEMPWVENMLAL